MKISNERWLQAQEAEKKFHKGDKKPLIDAYRESYRQYFTFVDINPHLDGKSVVEIGCANIPALMFCSGVGSSVIIEPMPSDILNEIAGHMDGYL